MATKRENKSITAATAFTALGWQVFPVLPTKAPATPHGFKDASAEAERVLDLFNRYPAPGVGIRTGKESGLLVLDVDTDKGGEESLVALESAHETLPSTLESLTGGGGRHLFFTHPRSGDIQCSAGLLGPGLDVRADGGYVVAPPSPHSSGGTYSWKDGRHPGELELAAPPAWLVGLLRSGSSSRHDAGGLEVTKSATTEPSGPVKRVLDALGEVREGASGWRALCPAHDDRNPSLSVGEGEDGRCLIHCFAGCSPEEVVEAINLRVADLAPPSRRNRASSRLLALAESAGVEPFHSPDGESYIAISRGGHVETWPIQSRDAERWLRQLHFESAREAVAPEVVAEAVATLDARAQFEGPEFEVYRRVAGDLTAVTIDRGDDDWSAIRVTAEGWEVIDQPGVHFRRDRSTQALPVPVAGASIEELREFTNCADERSWLMLVGFIVMCFNPSGPYPIAYPTGEQGSAKSTLSRMVASLVDPRTAPLIMGAPQVRDLATIASSVHLVGFDNVSKITPALSDALCQMATGAGYRARQLFTDAEPFILEFKRPVLLNGIGQAADRPDLLDRMALIELAPIDPTNRRTEADLDAAWKIALPRIFGAILDGVSAALAYQNEIEVPGHPRMADFARWGEAAGQAFGWEPGAFTQALESGRADLLEGSGDAYPEIGVLLAFMEKHDSWCGSASNLLAELSKIAEDTVGTGGRVWPKRASDLSNRLTSHAPLLRDQGLEIIRGRSGGGNRNRFISIHRRDAGTRGDG